MNLNGSLSHDGAVAPGGKSRDNDGRLRGELSRGCRVTPLDVSVQFARDGQTDTSRSPDPCHIATPPPERSCRAYNTPQSSPLRAREKLVVMLLGCESKKQKTKQNKKQKE